MSKRRGGRREPRQEDYGRNIGRPPLAVRHADLEREGEDSMWRSECPECGHGLLLVRRDQATLRISGADNCVVCGQGFVYLDLAGMRAREGDDAQEHLYARPAGPGPAEVRIGPAKSGDWVRVTVDEFGPAGYQWEVKSFDNVRNKGGSREALGAGVGAPSRREILLRLGEPSSWVKELGGAAGWKVELSHARPWEGGGPIDKFTLLVGAG